MSVAVRYFSRSGNTKKVADAMAEALGVEAISVDETGAALTEKVDTLFIGGAVYAYGIDGTLKEYLSNISGDKVGRAVLFSTSWITKHALDVMRKALVEKGIEVVDESFYCKSKAVDSELENVKDFAKKYM